MISFDDIRGMCTLTRQEIDAIAEHEHIGGVNAVLLAEHTIYQHQGLQHM